MTKTIDKHKVLNNRFRTNSLFMMKYNDIRQGVPRIKITIIFIALLLSYIGLNLKAQEIDSTQSINVKGIILSNPGKPVPNVSISIEGSTQLPVITDTTGKFELQSPSMSEWLIIAPTGNLKKKRVFLNGRTNLIIYLTSTDISSGQDEFNILSKTVQKRNITASYSELNTNKIYHTPAITVDEFMQGQVAGMNVVNRSGMPGSGAVTNIRGINSLNTNIQPLYVVDGIPILSQGIFGSNLDGYSYNPLLSINPLDISKTTIIKDPAITAAYGSKGSNGVILIETLDPSATQTSIEIDARGGYSLTPNNLIPQLDAKQHKTLMNEALFTSSLYEEEIKLVYPNLFLTNEDDRYINYLHNTNWQKLIYDDSYMKNINVKVKGGDQIARYGLSFGYVNSDGIIKTTGYEGYNLRFVSRLNIFKWLKMNAGVALSYNRSSLKEAATVDETSPILTSLAKSPLLNPYQYDIEGRMLTTLSDVDEIGVSNPVAIIDNYTADNTNYNFISTLNLEAAITEGLSLNSALSLAYNVLKEQLFMPNQGMELYYDQEAINVAKVTNNNITTFFNNTYLGFKKSFGTSHQFSSNTGVNLYTNEYELDWGLTKNASENDQYRALQDGQNNLREIGGAKRVWNWISIYENLNYSFRDKYLLTASLSLDGSSRVGENALNTLDVMGEPFGLFYAGGLGWRISNEPFFKNISWLEELKLRASYGISGNDDIGEASATNYYEAVKFRETVGLYPAVAVNDELTYETVTQINAGIDLSLLGNRFTTQFNYFMSETDNMLVFSPIDAYLGNSYRKENNGKMENVGWEISSFIRLIDGNSFKWDIQAHVTSIQNEIIDIEGDQLVTDILGAQIINKTGYSANSFYGYIYDGVFSTQQEANEAGLINDRGFAYQAGDAKFLDLSGPDGTPDGIINDYDKTILGSSLPELFGGLSTTFHYKRWMLSGFVQFVSKNELFNYVRYRNEEMSGLENQSTNTLNRWQYEGQQTDVPRALWGDPIGNSAFSSRWIEDGSYARIKNITLSYKIPKQFLSFKNAEFYISANNIYVFSDYLGYDPEYAYSYSNLNQGVDYGQTPQPRQFIAGVKLGL